jgi:hypothetical protein
MVKWFLASLLYGVPISQTIARSGVDLGRLDRKSVTFARVEAGLVRMRAQPHAR